MAVQGGHKALQLCHLQYFNLDYLKFSIKLIQISYFFNTYCFKVHQNLRTFLSILQLFIWIHQNLHQEEFYTKYIFLKKKKHERFRRSEHFEKQYWPILVTSFGVLIVSIDVTLNEYSPICSSW